MSEKCNWSQELGGRTEYDETPEHGAQETEDLCNLIHEVACLPISTDTTERDVVTSDSRDGLTINRSFSYLESNLPQQMKWPLSEKTIHIHYERSGGKLTQELFRVAIATTIHQVGVERIPILNVYEISTVGPLATPYATVEEPDIIGATDWEYAIRQVTPYDRETLSRELTQLRDLMVDHPRDDSLSKAIAYGS